MEHNLRTIKRVWITGTHNEIMAEIEKVEGELRDNLKTCKARKPCMACALIWAILGEEV